MRKEEISSVFAALADPTRRSILRQLSGKEERSVTGLAEPFSISMPAISRHLRVLEQAQLIDRRKLGREHMIRIRVDSLRKAKGWIEHTVEGWSYSFDKLDELLEKEEDGL